MNKNPHEPTRFQPGKSGNPGGRPKGLAAMVREEIKDGKELTLIMAKILRGDLLIEKRFVNKDGEEKTYFEWPSHRDRIAAAEWLADRGFGKAPEIVANLDLNDTKNEQAKAVAALLIQEGVIVADTQSK